MTYYGFPGLKPKARMALLRVVTQDRSKVIKDRFRRVIAAIERVTGKKWTDIRVKSKAGHLSLLRAIIAEYVYQPGLVSKKEVANLLGLKNHTSIYYYLDQLIPGLEYNYKFKKIYNEIYKYL